MRLQALHSGKSDLGRVRKQNEDAWAAGKLSNNSCYWLVCDGLGGHAAGELASKLCAQVCVECLNALTDDVEDVPAFLAASLQVAHLQLLQLVQTHPEHTGMGSTCTLAYLTPEGMLYYAHVGDSRLYHLRQGRLRQLTQDHTLVQELLTAGEIQPEDVHVHPQRNVLTRAIGLGAERLNMEVAKQPLQLQAGDELLLCTDGLTAVLLDEDIKQILLTPASPESRVESLIAAANDKGGPDNITTVLAHVYLAGYLPAYF